MPFVSPDSHPPKNNQQHRPALFPIMRTILPCIAVSCIRSRTLAQTETSVLLDATPVPVLA